jgi:short-subunit dehydrogenase
MKNNHKTYLIFGVSKGLGKALTLTLPSSEDIVYGVSRTQPDYLNVSARRTTSCKIGVHSEGAVGQVLGYSHQGYGQGRS